MLRHLLAALALIAIPLTCQAAEPPAIDTLIQQLGSDDFRTRESATAALERIGVPALPALQKAATGHADLEARRRAASLVPRIENSLDQLLIDYRAFGLPLPPDDAPLVRFQLFAGQTSWIQAGDEDQVDVRTPPTYGYGFLLSPAKEARDGTILHGLNVWQRSRKEIGPAVDPTRLDRLLADGNTSSATALALAIQMHARGWAIGRKVLDERGKLLDHGTPRHRLHMEVWEHWENQLFGGDFDDWPYICPRLKALMALEPKLDTAEHRALLKSLDLAVIPSKARPRTVEAFIDDFMRVTSNYWWMADRDERLDRVVDLGFDAVPALLDHVDDDRLTRYLDPLSMWGNSRTPPHRYRVGDMAGDVLRNLSGQDWPKAAGYRAEVKRRATEWWNDAQKEGEETYLVNHALPSDGTAPNHVMIRLIGKKYPRRLPALYRHLLEKRPDMQSWSLVEAIEACSLPKKEKVTLLVLGTEHRNLDLRRTAMWPLAKLARERCATRLIATLDEFPATPKGPYARCDETIFAAIACAVDDERAWRALDRTARRVDPGLRLELLNKVDFGEMTPERRRHRLAFLASFLDDQALRDAKSFPEMFEGSYAGSRFPRLEVRNFAALKMAEMLDIRADLKPKSGDAEWAKLRERMRKAAHPPE